MDDLIEKERCKDLISMIQPIWMTNVDRLSFAIYKNTNIFYTVRLGHLISNQKTLSSSGR